MNTSGQRSKLSYARQLFNNVYNYTLLAGVAIVSLFTGEWWLLTAGLSIEVLAMMIGPNLVIIRKKLDEAFRIEHLEHQGQHRESRIVSLGSDDRHRCLVILARQQELLRIVREKPDFSRQLMQNEIEKTDNLVEAFIDLVQNLDQLNKHLEREDFSDLERQARQYDEEAQSNEAGTANIARKNLEVIQKRIARLAEMNEFKNRASGQLSLIENSMRLLIDQALSMRNPGELNAELDSLLDGVDSVRQIALETGYMIKSNRRQVLAP